MNKIKAYGLIGTAKRTIKIIELILDGKETREILDELQGLKPRVERYLVDYYRRQLK